MIFGHSSDSMKLVYSEFSNLVVFGVCCFDGEVGELGGLDPVEFSAQRGHLLLKLNTDFRTHEIHRSEYFSFTNLTSFNQTQQCEYCSPRNTFSVVESCVAKSLVFCFGNGYWLL